MTLAILLGTTPFAASALAVFLAAHKFLPVLRATDDSIPNTSLYKSASNSLSYLFKQHGTNKRLVAQVLLVNSAVYTTLAASAVIVELVLCEIGNWLEPAARIIAWKCCTTVLLIMLVLVIPILEAFMYLYSANATIHARFKVPMLILVSTAWLLMFQKLGDYIPLPPPDHPTVVTKALSTIYWSTTVSRSFEEETLSRIVVIGVCAMAVLAGFAAVSTPYTVFFARTPTVTIKDLERSRKVLETTADQLQSKTALLEACQTKIKDQSALSNTNLRAKIFSSLRRSSMGPADAPAYDLNRECRYLEVEVHSLQTTQHSLQTNLQDLESAYARQVRMESKLGRLANKAQLVFAFYCVYRLFNVIFLQNPVRRAQLLFSMLQHPPPTTHALSSSTTTASDAAPTVKSDALAITLAHIAVRFSTYASVDAWTRQISFLLSGSLFVGSISSALTTFHSLLRAFPLLSQDLALAVTSSYSGLSMLIVAQVTAVYILSTSLMLRSNLPKEMSSAITAALGAPLDTRFLENLFDTLFALVALMTLVSVWRAHRYNKDDIDMFDEECLLESSTTTTKLA